MKDMFDTILTFVEAHWELILHIVLLLVSSVLFIIRKKPTKIVDGICESLFSFVLASVSQTENSGIKGSAEKLKDCIHRVESYYYDKYGTEIPFSVYYEKVVRYIEAILSTPQKKC